MGIIGWFKRRLFQQTVDLQHGGPMVGARTTLGTIRVWEQEQGDSRIDQSYALPVEHKSLSNEEPAMHVAWNQDQHAPAGEVSRVVRLR